MHYRTIFAPVNDYKELPFTIFFVTLTFSLFISFDFIFYATVFSLFFLTLTPLLVLRFNGFSVLNNIAFIVLFFFFWQLDKVEAQCVAKDTDVRQQQA